MPSKLVRLGRLTESGKFRDDFETALDKEVERRFRYKEVFALPDEADDWRAQAEKVLATCRVALDLTLEQEELIVELLNCPWSADHITHHCIKDRCRFKCNGSLAKSLLTVKIHIKVCIGPSMVVPLEYRWKGMEQA